MREFWTGKRILITGHTGFKGMWLTKWLDMLGVYTLGYSLAPDSLSVYDKIKFSGKHQSVFADIRDKSCFLDTVRDFSPEIIFHLAAQSTVSEAKERPFETFETNLMGTVNLLEAVKDNHSVRATVIITSDKVYENIETIEPYTEDARLGGNEPYAASKACAELAVTAYRNAIINGKKGIATARAANVYGGGDLHYDRLIPYLIKSKLENTPADIRNQNAVRPWQHVLSPLHGYMLLAEALYNEPEGFSEGFNFGPPEDEFYTVGDIANMIKGEFNQGRASVFKEAGLLRIDSSKSRLRLGWNHGMDIQKGLDSTIDFYRCMYAGNDVTELVERTINIW